MSVAATAAGRRDATAAGALLIVAGSGRLPRLVCDGARMMGRSVAVVVIRGQGDAAAYRDVPHKVIRLGAAGEMLAFATEQGCSDIVLAGGVRRPSIAGLMPDRLCAAFFAKVGVKALGDDGLMRAIREELETVHGLRVRAPPEFADHLRLAEGVLTRRGPDAQARRDIARGLEVIEALGRVDVGQAAVIQQGLVLAVEAIEGTDAMIQRAGALAREGAAPVLVKAPKPGQDRHLDLPALGPQTVLNAAHAGFVGIAGVARSCLLMDREEAVAAADRAGLFLVGVTAKALSLDDAAEAPSP